MIEKIKYYKRHLYKSGKFIDVYPLARIEHPLAIETLLEAAESDAIGKKTRALVYDALLMQDDPRGHELIIEMFQTTYQQHHNILSKIHKLQDQRIVPTLKNTLSNLQDIPRLRHEIIILETMRCLAKIAAREAIPLLNGIIENYPFTSEEKLVPNILYGLMALTALKEIDDPIAKPIVDKWDKTLQSRVKFHIEQGTILPKARQRLRIPYEMGIQPDLIQYMLEELISDDSKLKTKIISFLVSKLLQLKNQADLQQQILNAFYQIARESDDMGLRRMVFKHLASHNHEHILDLALSSLEFPELRMASIQVLSDKKYPHAVEKVIELIEEERQFSGKYRYYLYYLGLIGTERAEKKLISMFEKTTSLRYTSFTFGALALIAQHSDNAFERICQSLEHQDKNIRKQAIIALGKVGEPAMTVLITLLHGDKFQIIEALKALKSTQFQNALPYIAPFLSHDSVHIRRIACQTILAFKTEGAFALLNAYETSSDSMS